MVRDLLSHGFLFGCSPPPPPPPPLSPRRVLCLASAFATAEELPRRRSRVVPMPVRIPPPAVTPVMIPPGQMPEPDPVSEEGERSGSASVTGATPMSKSSSADAGAGDAKPVSRRAAFGSDAVSAGKVAELLTSDEDEDGAAAPPVVASKDLVSPHTLGAGGAACTSYDCCWAPAGAVVVAVALLLPAKNAAIAAVSKL